MTEKILEADKVWKQSKGRCLCQSSDEQKQCLFFMPGMRVWCIYIDPYNGVTCRRVAYE